MRCKRKPKLNIYLLRCALQEETEALLFVSVKRGLHYYLIYAAMLIRNVAVKNGDSNHMYSDAFAYHRYSGRPLINFACWRT